jgi:hypothetical protein
MLPIMQGFSDEIIKLAVGDLSAESPTTIFNDPLELGRESIEKTQGRMKNLPGGVSGTQRVNVHKPTPAPETTPTSMLGYIP